MISDSPPKQHADHDVCIVGTGPLGLTLALECAALGLSVVMLEAGSYNETPELSEASRAEIVDERLHAPMEIATRRALGGGSWLWGGRCVPFDAIDYAERAYVPLAAWPFGAEELAPWYATACRHLFAGEAVFQSPPPRFADAGPDVDCNHLERWSGRPRMGSVHAHRQSLQQSSAIAVHLNSTVTDLDIDAATGTVGAVVAGPRGMVRVGAKRLVLAMGGLETTRLLLMVQERREDLFGGKDGPLGRFYMGHISGKIADIVFEDPADIEDFDLFRDPEGLYVRRRFVLKDAAQQREAVLNAAFWPDNSPFWDARHGSAVLSAVFLAMAFKPLGRRLMSENIRLGHIGPAPRDYPAHIGNVLKAGPSIAAQLLGIVRDRMLVKPPKPGFLVRNTSGRYALHYHAEQVPNPDSRVTLTSERDCFGLPRLRIDYRFTDADAESVIRSHQVLDNSLRAGGRSHLEYRYPEAALFDRVMGQATDGVHQVGTTRMGADPATSVVDANLKVHGLRNLYIASTSVMPSTGQANPTLAGAALAVRLAHHLLDNAVA